MRSTQSSCQRALERAVDGRGEIGGDLLRATDRGRVGHRLAAAATGSGPLPRQQVVGGGDDCRGIDAGIGDLFLRAWPSRACLRGASRLAATPTPA